MSAVYAVARIRSDNGHIEALLAREMPFHWADKLAGELNAGDHFPGIYFTALNENGVKHVRGLGFEDPK